MNKSLTVGVMVVVAVLVARRLVHTCAEGGCERMLARMPDDAPPKWMFRNIEAIRENTERILARLEGEPAPEASESARAGV